ncbi:uncharacterized protein LOC142235388 [Haematobia irritans]|uniref:uncharacterized protein LOC142235388 n=1 Tax=Haematobia irritans TaxID=7368 RepID=UPI003F50186F
MKKLSRDVEYNIVSLTNKGSSSRKMVKELNISQSVIIRVQKGRHTTPNEQNRGRRKLLTEADARLIMAEMRQNKSVTPKNTTVAKNKQVSEYTARRVLHNIGYVSDVKNNKPALSENNQKVRIKFAKEHTNLTTDDWKRVIWPDDSKFNRFQSNVKKYCWRRPGTDPTLLKVLLCAPTGKAAFGIDGTTLHPMFSLPVNESTCGYCQYVEH